MATKRTRSQGSPSRLPSTAAKGKRPRVLYTPSAEYAALTFRDECTINLLLFHKEDTKGATLRSRQIIHTARWDSIVTPLTFMYPRLVRGFFENMQLPEDPEIKMFKTIIDGYMMEVTPAWINQHLRISPTAPTTEACIPGIPPFAFRPSTDDLEPADMVETITTIPATYLRGSMLPDQLWLLDHLLYINLWNHGHPQQYVKAFLRLCYHLFLDEYFDLGEVIFDSMVECKQLLKKKKITSVWSGHLISRMLRNCGLPIEQHEPTEAHLIPYTWDSWGTLYAARDLARRGRLGQTVGEGTGDTAETSTPLPARASSSRKVRTPPLETVTRDELRTAVTCLVQQISFFVSLQIQLAHKLVGNQGEYDALLSAAMTDAATHQTQLLAALYPTDGSAPTTGPAFPTNFTRPILPRSDDLPVDPATDDDDDA